jgi:thiol-disulfide isomerase/thioredoxin
VALSSKILAPAVQLAFIAGAAVLVYSFVAVAREAEARRKCSSVCTLHPNYAGASRRVPDFALKDMKGREVTSASLRGKVVVMNFWTKTCGPCLQEMPEIEELAKILRPKPDVALLTVSTDDGPSDIADTLKSVLREEPSFPVLLDPDSRVVAAKFGTHLFPETWIIDKRGVVRARFDGAREWASSAVVELVDELREGGYCAVEMREGKVSSSGDAARACDLLARGAIDDE